MRGTAVRGLIGFGLACVLAMFYVFSPGPAHAVDAPPKPVIPSPALPSTTQKGLTSAGGIGDDVIKVGAWLLGEAKRAQTAAAAGAAAPAVVTPVTGAATLAKGGGLTLPFMIGWGITDGTLAMYAATTGTDPMAGTCNQIPLVQSAISIMYPFSAPDCTVAVVNPDGDVVGEAKITHNGKTLTYSGTWLSGNTTFYCYKSSTGGVWPSSGFTAFWSNSNGTSGSGSFGSGSQLNSNCGGAAMYMRSSTNAAGPQMGVRNVSTGQTVASWVQTTPHPTRRSDCKLTWPDGTTTTGQGDAYREQDGINPSGIEKGCRDAFVSKPGHGPDLLPSKIDIGSTNDDTGARTELATQDVPAFGPDEKKGLTTGTGTGGLVLRKVVGTTLDSCMTWAADCAGWWEDPDKTDKYRCTFNGAAVDLAECGIYRYTFDTKTDTPTITDPQTGEEVEWGTQPGGSNSTSPAPGNGPAPGEQCMSSWPSLADPINWVLHPVKCALVWAFVPRASEVTDKGSTIQRAWDKTMPAKLLTLVPAMFVVPGGDSSCQGPHVYFEMNLFGYEAVVDWYPLSVCEAPMSDIAATSRLFSSAILIYMTALGVVRRGSAVFNAPGVGGGGPA